MSYTLPRPSHNWKAYGADFSCTECACRKAIDVDSGAMSTGCTGKSFCWFPGPNFQADPAVKGVTWDQLDGSRTFGTSAYYEHKSESGPTLVPQGPGTVTTSAATKPAWQGDFEVGDRVFIIDECEGTIMGFLTDRKLIDVLRDDDECGSGLQYTKKDGKTVDGWVVSKDEITLLTSGTRIPGEGMAVAEPHKMGLDPETIDWSKFKKIRDML